MAQLSKENSLQREAFEFYYHMGEKRSLKAVAHKVDRTERTVAGWSRTFNWVDRVKQREIEDAKNLRGEALNSQTTDVKTRYRILVNNLMSQFSKKIANGEVAIKTISDLERLVKLDLLLMGEAGDRQELIGALGLSKESEDKLLDIYKKIKEM